MAEVITDTGTQISFHINGFKEPSIPVNPVVDVISQQAEKPPGKDQYIGAFYSSFLDYLHNGDSLAMDLIHNVQQERQLTPELHTNLLFRAVQQTLLGSPGYPHEFDTKDRWHEFLVSFFSQQNSDFATVRETLLTKDTSTTVYQRYVGERAIMAFLAGGESVCVADIGCGGNYGLPGMELNEPFKPIKDNTDNRLVSKYLETPLLLEEGLAIDLHDPKKPDSIAWRHSCGIYPTELINGELERIEALEERLERSTKVGFRQADLLHLEDQLDLPRDSCDFVLMNTMLYQLPFSQQKEAIRQARLLLKEHGALFIQDFAIKHPDDPTQLQFEGVSWGAPGSYRLFVTNKKDDSLIYEALRWNSGRCTEVEPGNDFYRLGELHPLATRDQV